MKEDEEKEEEEKKYPSVIKSCINLQGGNDFTALSLPRQIRRKKNVKEWTHKTSQYYEQFEHIYMLCDVRCRWGGDEERELCVHILVCIHIKK